MALRETLGTALKDAADDRTAATVRLILVALKERDHCAREAGGAEGLSDAEIADMIRDMVEQRRQEIGRCEELARLEDAETEAAEIAVLERFLPHRMSDAEIGEAVDREIAGLGASRLKDAGKVIAALKERYDGAMDFARAKKRVCERLG